MPDTPAPDERPPADAPVPADPASDTIDPTSEVDEASYETFPASDPPGFGGGIVTAADYDPPPDDEADD